MGGLDRTRKIVKVDPLKIKGKILCKEREIPYDTLVLALGAVTDTFGVPGAREHCMFLNSQRDAERMRLTILTEGT